jgi:hypothetical protein
VTLLSEFAFMAWLIARGPGTSEDSAPART